jgi:outer membrane protein insertion porin family
MTREHCKFFLFLVFGFLFLTGISRTACAADSGKNSKLVILPFEINAQPELAYLEESLPTLLEQRLADKGIPVQSRERTMELIADQEIDYLDMGTARDLALLSSAGYAVYGSFSQVGETLSIDVRLVEAFGLRAPKALFVTRQGLINVLPAIDELAEKITQHLRRQEAISTIEVQGNRILEKDVVLMRLKIQEGDIYDPRAVNKEIKRLYGLGYFDDVQAALSDTPDGKKLTFIVKEKPLIQAIGVVGAKEIDQDDILEAISSKTGAVLNPGVLADDMGKIRELYRKDGYYNAKVDYELEQSDDRQARLNIVIDEGKKLYIKKIAIQGAEQLDPDDLEDELALSRRGLFSWITGSGVLKEELLDRDAAALEAYYGNRGFVDAKVGQPEVTYEEDGIVITFKIREGKRYRAGSVRFAGDILVSEETLHKVTKMDDLQEDEEFFDRSVLRRDSQALADFYTDFGYAYAEADTRMSRDEDAGIVNVTYLLSKGEKVFIRRVAIQGNTKTRDNVIRREMRLADGSLFSGSKLRRSSQRLTKLDYFETADIQTVPTGDPNTMDLVVKVKEKSTGTLSAGTGYSSTDSVFVTGSVQERNLFGKGYLLNLSGSLSGSRNVYDLNFWNPSFRDSRLGLGGEVYLRNEEFSDYDKDSVGGRVKFAYPLGEYTKLYWNYRLENYDIKELDDDADRAIREIEGNHWASSVTGTIKRDSTNRRINPSKGSVNSLSVEYAGGLLMGDDEFVKYVADTSWYFSLPLETIFHAHGQAGYIMKNGSDSIPPFERFYLGGINSLRGYKGRTVSPRYESSDEEKGGTSKAFVNLEYIFPVNKELGLLGLLFFDAGNTWDDDETPDADLYKSVGAGIRWFSPLGPLRLEYGYPLDELYDEDREGRLEFSVGQTF